MWQKEVWTKETTPAGDGPTERERASRTTLSLRALGSLILSVASAIVIIARIFGH